MAQHWFKHDYGARNDEKILELRAEYGWKGYGLFFGLIESMCEQETGAIDRDRIGGLCVAYNLPKDELLAFIDFCISIDLFFEDDDGLIKNDRVIDHLDQMSTLKEAGKKGARIRWKGHKNRGANRGANTTPNAEKIREDKRRESVDTSSADFPSACTELEDAKELAGMLLKAIKYSDPEHKYHKNPPSKSAFRKWVLEIERGLRIDGRKPWQFERIIRYVFGTNSEGALFWRPNIQSGKKLRDQFEKVKGKIIQEKGSFGPPKKIDPKSVDPDQLRKRGYMSKDQAEQYSQNNFREPLEDTRTAFNIFTLNGDEYFKPAEKV